MMQAKCLAVLIFVLLVLVPSRLRAGDGYVGVYANAAGTQTCTAVPQYTGATLHVLAKIDGGTANGIVGAEFRIEIPNPAGWFFMYTPPPAANAVLGNPLDTSTDSTDVSGLNISFPACVPPVAGNIELGTISVFNVSGSPTALLVRRHERPSNAGYSCPLFVTCDAPVYTKRCMSAAPADSCSIGIQKSKQRTESDPIVFAALLNNTSSSSSRSAQFEPVRSVIGGLPVFTPWSPVGSRLAFCRNDSLFVFDPSQPTTPPCLVLAGASRYAAWSPDGQWIAALRYTAEDLRQGLATLVAAPVTGGASAVLIERAEISQFRWAGNGNIYYWETRTGFRRTIPPPTAWQPDTLSLDACPILIPYVRARSAPELHTFLAGPVETETRASGLDALDAYTVLALATMPDCQHFLVDAYRNDGVHTVIVDQAGSVVTDFGNHHDVEGFAGTSVSVDGRYLVGHSAVDDGENVLRTRIYVAAADGSWRIPIAGVTVGWNPQLSAADAFLAFEEPMNGVIHVGTILVSME